MSVTLHFQAWDFVLAKDDSRLITGSADMELRVWELINIDQVSMFCYMFLVK